MIATDFFPAPIQEERSVVSRTVRFNEVTAQDKVHVVRGGGTPKSVDHPGNGRWEHVLGDLLVHPVPVQQAQRVFGKGQDIAFHVRPLCR